MTADDSAVRLADLREANIDSAKASPNLRRDLGGNSSVKISTKSVAVEAGEMVLTIKP
jgi:hypothetical protein